MNTLLQSPVWQGLLAAILEEPQSDDLRLIAADWLEENGELERGEFVRVQVELAKKERRHAEVLDHIDGEQAIGRINRDKANILKATTDLQLYELRRRERELLEARNLDRWLLEVLPDLAFWQRTSSLIDCFRRGFLAEITCTLADWCGKECSTCQLPGRVIFFRCCDVCHGAGRIGIHGPALVRAAPLARVALTEWRGERCAACEGTGDQGIHWPEECEVCHGLYNSDAALAWARDYHYCTDIA